MEQAAAGGRTPAGRRDTDIDEGFAKLWWLFLGAGVLWILIALVILQFDRASVTTVGVLIGIMLVISSVQYLAIGTLAGGFVRVLWWLFAALLLIAGVVTFISPENTFAALADILGFVFLIIGAFWTIEAFIVRDVNPLWWLGLVSGVLMIVLAFWTAGQFFLERAYVLLVFAGIWALMHGVGDIVRAFQFRALSRYTG